MKPIVRKILESGLVSKHTALLMERWGYLENGAHGLVGKEDLREASDEVLRQFLDDIEALIDEERESFRETKMSIQVGDPILAVVSGCVKVVIFKDEMGNFMFPAGGNFPIDIGEKFHIGRDAYIVEEKIPLYKENQIYGIQVTASRAG